MIDYDPTTLLFIEPKTPTAEPIIDGITRKITAAWRARRTALNGARGWHNCTGSEGRCGASSDNHDHWVMGYKTNSLCIHYVACHRDAVPQTTLALIASWTPEAEPTYFDLHGKEVGSSGLGGPSKPLDGMAQAQARQASAEESIPSGRDIKFTAMECAGTTWHQAEFRGEHSGWCVQAYEAQERLQTWILGNVVSMAPPGQCSPQEIIYLATLTLPGAEKENDLELMAIVERAIVGGLGSEAWFAVTAYLHNNQELITQIGNANLPSSVIQRPNAV